MFFASPCKKRNLLPVGNADNRDQHRVARRCVGTGGRCSETGEKHVHTKDSAPRSEFYSSRDHTKPRRLSFGLAMFLTMNA